MSETCQNAPVLPVHEERLCLFSRKVIGFVVEWYLYQVWIEIRLIWFLENSFLRDELSQLRLIQTKFLFLRIQFKSLSL